MQLVAPCSYGNGILAVSDDEREYYRSVFLENQCAVSFFIPASGAGSRMFDFLHEYLKDPESQNLTNVERFLRNVKQFAFSEKIAPEILQSFQNGTLKINEFLRYLLFKEGLNLSSSPKGLIPFHTSNTMLLNPVQEYLLQGEKLRGREKHFHFTVQQEYLKHFEESIAFLENVMNLKFSYSFSFQDPNSDSYSFRSDGSLFTDESGNPLMRPSGHGALLENVSLLKNGIIFIKNIDNIQHLNKSLDSVEALEFLGGLLLEIKQMTLEVFNNPTERALKMLNERYQLIFPDQLSFFSTEDGIRKLLQRPLRVCGMVENEGQPGGGPFWLKSKGVISKQIVEKAQIASNEEQMDIMMRSTHFNPVFMALDPTDFNGKRYDLQEFVDQEMYFKVNKSVNGNSIGYIEKPGLWNGSMAHWNTVFVELPSSVFSPVKSILDLLDKAHLAD
ncbi:MAG: hypothetical protein RIT43_685 [Bacteroidota bacterium]